MNKNYIIKVKDILKIIKGNLIIGNEETECETFITDSRKIRDGEIYVGIVGETVNGGVYFEKAFENGAIGVIIQNINITEQQKEKYKDKIIIKVENTLLALQKIAEYKRSLYGENFPVIAITGSVGKTSTKDIVANVIAQKYKTLKTEGNYNNHIGLPLTLLKLKDHEAAVVEMGMNHLGEIRVLTNIAKPTLCVITNIGTAHIGNLGSRENILKSKLEILEGNNKKEIVINNDNDLLNKFNKEKDASIQTITYGINEEAGVYATNIVEEAESSKFICHIGNEQFEVTVPVAGKHFIENSLCAAAVGNKLGLTKEQIKKGIETFELTKKRMDITELKNGAKLINDSYNASYESMKASIENLSKYQGRKIAVLGDMFELGEYEKELHQKVGKEVVKNNIDILICTGKNAKQIVETAQKERMNNQKIYYLENKQQILDLLKNILKKGDTILLKASNGMKFYEIAEKLK